MSMKRNRSSHIFPKEVLIAPEVRDHGINDRDNHNHLRLLFRRKGSVWPRVFPYCLINTILAGVSWYYIGIRGLNVEFSQDANGYLASLLAFLVVTRVRLIYDKNMFTRGQLEKLCKSCEELVQNAISLTSHNTSRRAQQWRDKLAYMTIVLLKQTMHAHRRHSEMSNTKMTDEMEREDGANFQKPVKTAYKLRKAIVKNGLGDTFKSQPAALIRLSMSIDQYTTAYHELEGIAYLSFPFPLVQMARTILFVWLACLPLALCEQDYPLWGICLMVFLLTFGFTGLEIVSIEMSDPFGMDVTDFDLFFMAQATFEDIYIMIYNVHGMKAAEELVHKIRNPTLEALM